MPTPIIEEAIKIVERALTFHTIAVPAERVAQAWEVVKAAAETSALTITRN